MMLPVSLCLLAICVTVYSLPSSLLDDVKTAEAEINRPRMNKVKRAQEVIMFGNQQNKAGDGRNNYARADKRGDLEELARLEEINPNFVPLMPLLRENDLDIEPPRALPLRQSAYELLSNRRDPYYNDYRYLAQRRKRSNPNHLSRSSRVFRSARSPSRTKRDLEIDPEDLFALLALWESERRNNPRYPEYQQREYLNFPYDQNRKLSPDDEDINEISDGEDMRESGWLDGPIKLPSHKFISQEYPYPDWTPALLHQVRQLKEGDKVKSISDLLANAPVRDPNVPVHRRFML